MDTPPPKAPASTPTSGGARSFMSPRWASFEELGKRRGKSPASAGVKERVRSITSRLSQLQKGLEEDKKKSRKALDNRLEELDQKFIASRRENENHRKELADTLEDMAESVEQERLARELLDERKTKELEAAHKKMEVLLEKFKQKRLASEQDLADQIQGVKREVETERKLRVEAEERFGVHLGDQVARCGWSWAGHVVRHGGVGTHPFQG